MESRFNQQKANLRSYLRNWGAEIDVKRKTIRIEIDSLNQKELGKLEELKRWGYQVNEDAPPESPSCNIEFENDSFISFADEIMSMYY